MTNSSHVFPTNAWYALATSEEVGRAPLGRRALNEPIVLYRDSRGDVVALRDRCVHRPYPLSRGRVEGDCLVARYTGFVYGPDGVVRQVPTQAHVPIGAKVRSFPVVEADGFCWVWMGRPELADRRPVPRAEWLEDEEWTTFGDVQVIEASADLLQDNFADITHIAHVDDRISPPVLKEAPPPIEVEVTETQVRFSRDFPAACVQPWQAEVLGVPVDSEHVQREEGEFVAPGLWVDRWHITVEGERHTLVFTHTITPVTVRQTLHHWRVSRSFVGGRAATGTMRPIFSDYYASVAEELEIMQGVLDTDGDERQVNTQADRAMLQMRKIMRHLGEA